MRTIDSLYVLLSQEETQEGIIAKKSSLQGSNAGVWTPFICSDETLLDDLKREAKIVSSQGEMKVKLVKFTMREELEEWDGRNLN